MKKLCAICCSMAFMVAGCGSSSHAAPRITFARGLLQTGQLGRETTTFHLADTVGWRIVFPTPLKRAALTFAFNIGCKRSTTNGLLSIGADTAHPVTGRTFVMMLSGTDISGLNMPVPGRYPLCYFVNGKKVAQASFTLQP